MGRAHAQSLLSDIKGAELTAVCDSSPERLDWAEEHLPDSVQRFLSPEELFKSGAIDAVLIATPIMIIRRWRLKRWATGCMF